MYAGHNIRFNLPTIETIEIDDQLKRYEAKDDIHKSDIEFFNLVDKIGERKEIKEISRAFDLLVKFGNKRYEKMLNEENSYKKQKFPDYILPLYKRAIEISSGHFDTTEIEKEVEKLEKT